MVIIALGPPGRIRTIPGLGASDDIPNLDLKVSSELSAMCSTDYAVTDPGLSFPDARPLKKPRGTEPARRPTIINTLRSVMTDRRLCVWAVAVIVLVCNQFVVSAETVPAPAVG
jgi:hypothetical protein